MSTFKLRILTEIDNFDEKLFYFFLEKSISFRRQYFIDNILKNSSSFDKSFFDINSQIYLEGVYGSTFQSSYRKKEDIYSLTHTINRILKEGDYFFAEISPSEYGKIIEFEKAVLRPVFSRQKGTDEFKIVTFDIDFNIIKDIDQ